MIHNYLEQWLELCECLFQKGILYCFTRALLHYIFFKRFKMCLGINWISEIMVQFCHLLHFSQSTPTLKFKIEFTIEFFAAFNYNNCNYYSHKQWSLNHRNTQSGSKTTNHKPWPFEPVKFCFLRGRLKWLMAVKNANVCWLLNFWICMFLKSSAILYWGIETIYCHLLL